jgi:two-component sensor histidine kinase
VVRSAHAGDALARTISLATRQGGFTGEVINRRKDGHEFPVELWTSVVRNDAGEPVALVGVARDITGRKKAEEQIRLSLREKEVLLKEIHHRVKNNLQVISSLLSLQASRLTNTETLAAFRESQARVKSMALVHEELYQSEDLSCIDFGDYLHRLGASLVNMYRTPMSSIEVVIDAERVYLSVDAAVPCGLIVNELVSNAMKHAFAGRTRGTVRVSFVHCDPRSALTVQDDGIGLPAGIDVGATESLGLQLVNALVHQLGGTLAVDREGGTTFKVEFTRHGRPIDVAAVHHAQPQHVSTE